MSDDLRMDELSTACGITPRNIRRYITLGLIAPPKGRTRNATYNASHLADLLTVRTLLLKGLSLQQAKGEMSVARGLPKRLPAGGSGAFLRWIPVVKGVSLVFDVGGQELPKTTQDDLIACFALQCAELGLQI